MIDPINSLAFSVHANRSVYALLLGSGVSRAARIPTGWEITLDLIGQLGALSDESPASREAWYREKYDKEPDYSALLEDLAKTPAERQQLLRRYWEPTPEEREQGAKAPTAAHRAIAKLVGGGYIKVIITTNFDRLIESALGEEGVQPQVLSTKDQIRGAVPIVHAPCTVLKLHGDYLDTRIRNTPQELEKYPEEYNRLLDRIFDEFGLIVCGWSAEWDAALRDAICRATCRRYTTYWTVHGELGERGQALIAHRQAETISIQDADSFFQALAHQVASIEDFSRPHPLSTEIAVATVKRFLPDEQFDIRLHDLVNDLVESVVQGANSAELSVYATLQGKELNTRMHRYDALCETLVAIAAIGGYWCEQRHHSLWAMALRRLIDVSLLGGYRGEDLRRYPATLLFYSLGIGAAARQKFHLLGHLLSLPSGVDRKPCLADVLSPFHLGYLDLMRGLEGMFGQTLPLNRWIFRELRKPFRSVLRDDSTYERAFDEFEILVALNRASKPHPPADNPIPQDPHLPGCYVDRNETDRILYEIHESISEEGDSSPYVASGIFGTTLHECNERLSSLKRYIPQMKGWLNVQS